MGVAGTSPGISGAGSPAADFAWIRDAIQHAIAYPATARRMGWEGKVVVAFQLLSDGSVRDVRVVQGSGHAALDRGAIDAVRNASPFPRSPVEAEVITPVVYRLTPR
jgi:protein TonB